MKLTRLLLLTVAGLSLALIPRSSAKNNDRYAKKYQENKSKMNDMEHEDKKTKL